MRTRTSLGIGAAGSSQMIVLAGASEVLQSAGRAQAHVLAGQEKAALCRKDAELLSVTALIPQQLCSVLVNMLTHFRRCHTYHALFLQL
jgi:hypothetical protein